ncbi:MAG: hypothetical protein GY810_15660 [Aureispira sp.]|nr:hypothetical protein [Aureispira sp.]
MKLVPEVVPELPVSPQSVLVLAQETAPEPSVVNTCPVVPSAVGRE